MRFHHYHPEHLDLEGSRARAKAFLALVSNSDRRFSDEAIEMIDSSLWIIEASTPTHYDADSEVKTGGSVGVGVVLPDKSLLIAVSPDARRQGVASRLFQSLRSETPHHDTYCTLSIHNRDGQMFALSQGMITTGIDMTGFITYRSNA